MLRLALRPEIAAGSIGESVELIDPLLGRTFTMGAPGIDLVKRLDGRRTAAELIAELAEGGAVPAQVESLLRQMLLLNLISGVGDPIRQTVAAILTGGAALDYVTLEGAQFGCQGSGRCCQGYVFGPLRDEDITRLDGRDLAADFPQLGGGSFWEEATDEDGTTMRRLRTIDERCVFLRDDHLCGLHAVYGAEAKPGFCRLYPIESLSTIGGIHVYDRGSCATWAISSRSGLPLADDMARLRTLLPEQGLYHPIVLLPAPDADLPIDYGWYHVLLDGQLELVRRQVGTTAETLRALLLLLLGFTRRVAACAIDIDEPVTSLIGVLSEPMTTWYPPAASEAQMREGAAAIALVTGELLDSLHRYLRGAIRSGGNLLTSRLTREAYQVLDLVRAAAAQAADARVALPPQHVPAVMAPWAPGAAAEIERLLRKSLEQQLFSYRALVDQRPVPALMRIALIQLMAVFGARLQAGNYGRAVVATDLSWGHALAVRLLDAPGMATTLVGQEDLTRLMIEALPMLLGLAGR